MTFETDTNTTHFTQPEWARGGGNNSLVARGSSAAHAADIRHHTAHGRRRS